MVPHVCLVMVSRVSLVMVSRVSLVMVSHVSPSGDGVPCLVNYLNSFIYGAGIPGMVVIVVITTTIITAMKIRQAAAWRAGTSTASGSSSSSISPREVALTKMLIGTSVLFIVCISPFVFFHFFWLFLPEMSVGRRNQDFYLVGLWIVDISSSINAAFNIFVYYTMGSRYRETFWALFGRKKRSRAKGNPSRTSDK